MLERLEDKVRVEHKARLRERVNAAGPAQAGMVRNNRRSTAHRRAISQALSVRYLLSTLVQMLLAAPALAQNFVADGFDGSLLGTHWTVVDPQGDGTVFLEGGQLHLHVPGGVSHNPWHQNLALRAMQPLSDTDFSLTVKFTSEPNARYQMQGLLIEQDAGNWLRFDTLHDGSRLAVFAAATVNGRSTPLLNTPVPTGSAARLRVTRKGNEWTMEAAPSAGPYSIVATFNRVLVVRSAGIFAANHPSNSAEFVALADVIEATALPGEESAPDRDDNNASTGGTQDSTGRGTGNAGDGPLIDLWYGDHQTFGHNGNPQPRINLLGNVRDSNGVQALRYALNGGAPIGLTIGRDGRRLARPGDFNADIPVDRLRIGENNVVLTAVDGQGNRAARSVVIDYLGARGSLPTVVDWSRLSSQAQIQDVAQVVDGYWRLENGRLRTGMGQEYDRLVAFGDMTWSDYEFTVPITVHSIRDFGSGIGVLARWVGHSDAPISCAQPKCGWHPIGAFLWHLNNRLTIWVNDEQRNPATTSPVIPGATFWYKGRVETLAGGASMYSFKVWPSEQREPATWTLQAAGDPEGPDRGSLLFIAHNTDASFGRMTVTKLSSGQTAPSTADLEDDGNSGGSSEGDVAARRFTNDSFETTGLGSHWTVVDPRGDGNASVSSGQLRLTVPSGISHDPWHQNNALRVMQPMADDDFTLQVQFASEPNARYQMQGLIIEQDPGNWLRFDIHHRGDGLYAFAAVTQNGRSSPLVDVTTTRVPESTRRIRVTRAGDRWILQTASGSGPYSTAAVVTQPLSVSAAGVFSGNHPSSAPGFTAIVEAISQE